ncbi:DUF2953 domain-containing protein [Pseudobacillus wudalianchiensis]|uniref:DUF2953 domain-containing protein n=1 Tax=Pseudobacillus wudalianchiensis TaxID=1743143 RepID=A0A1B9B843_9BACI|nr:DUF2953 domain-containing protein [Bacillus wudalianchiensis]OCA92246.1 hypothetical protein A8F95_00515 [Bacillus wudalianchiensis]
MAYLWWGLAIFLIFLFIACLLKIQLLFYFLRMPEKTEAYIRFFFFYGLLSYTFYIPFTKGQTSKSVRKKEYKEVSPREAEDFLIQVKEKLEYIESLQYIVRSFFKKIEIRTFSWRTVVGMKDAAWTGTAAGALWALKGSVISAAHRMVQMTARPELEVTPVFGQSVWKVEWSCMISFRIGHAISAVIQLFLHRRHRKKSSTAGLFF